jgi:hypothetical protein
MENKILELSQEKSENVMQNGVWQTNLSDKNILLKEGSEVNIFSVFLDTVSQSNGKVNIEQDLTLTMGLIQYMYMWTTRPGDFVFDPIINDDQPNGQRYLKCRFTTTGGEKLEKIVYEYSGTGGELWGDIIVNYSYSDLNGITQYFHVNIPALNKDRQNSYTENIDGILMEINSLLILNKTLVKEAGVKIPPTNTFSDINPGVANFVPEIEYFSFTLEKGAYDPKTLANILSRKMSVNRKVGDNDNNFVKSPFLADTDDNDGTIRYINENGEQSLQILQSDSNTSGNSYWSGANQIQWTFDDQVNKFSLSFLHFPILDSANGTDISVRYFVRGELASNEILTATCNSGCVITSLTSQLPDGAFTDFWSSGLGFNTASMAARHTSAVTNNITSFPGCITPRFQLFPGLNLIDGFVGLDTAVIKGASSSWWAAPTTSDLPLESTITDTNSILAETAFENLILGTSHFLIELNSTFINNFVTQTESKSNIQGIVSRYYGFDQYTSSEGQGGIRYIHRGAPVYIKTINCRVLNPDLSVASIGNKNHIYIQVIEPDSPPSSNAPATHTHKIN